MRVSSENERQVLDLQYDALINEGVDPRHIFQDKVSGARDNREGLQKTLDYLKKGDCLVVWKLDRLGRSLSNLISIVDEFKDKGIGFKSITEQMDTTTPHGEFLFSVFGALAQYERALTRERVMAGLTAAKKRGEIGGRPKAISDEKMQNCFGEFFVSFVKTIVSNVFMHNAPETFNAVQVRRIRRQPDGFDLAIWP